MKTIKINQWSEVPRKFTGITSYPNGMKKWLEEGKFHRLDGPAKTWSDGYKEWWLEDKHYSQINLNDYVVLDSYQGKYNLTWYKLLEKDKIVDYPDIPGLITK